MTDALLEKPAGAWRDRQRLGFLGVGWIGLHRMKAIIEADTADVVAIADPSAGAADEARKLVPGAERAETLGDLLALDLDGVVIATPTALHAEQSIRALEHGVAVFCQKPLGRTATETLAVVEAARAADRLLAVDLSYRFTEGIRRIRDLVSRGELGRVYAVDLVFHNAYGPDKPWFYDPVLSGGGCVMDLGIHLVDLVLWMLDCSEVGRLNARLLAGGEPLGSDPDKVEDYAVASFELATGAVVQLSCSWRLNAGRDAIISAAFYGTQGGAALRNVNGSFYDFVAERYRGTATEILAAPADAWFGRAAADWARRLAAGERFDPAAGRLVGAAQVLDGIYGRAQRV
jgi:predicted dehydrogenase